MDSGDNSDVESSHTGVVYSSRDSGSDYFNTTKEDSSLHFSSASENEESFSNQRENGAYRYEPEISGTEDESSSDNEEETEVMNRASDISVSR